MDAHIESGDYRGRSEWLRVAAREKLQAQSENKGHLHGSITIAYEHGKEDRISDVRHQHHDVVLSLMHTHCDPHTCMDVLIVGGDAAPVQSLLETLQRLPSVKQATFVPIA